MIWILLTDQMALVIGVVGRKGSGKDTLADHVIRSSTTRRIDKMSMASPIKDACRILFDLSEDQLNGSLKEDIDKRWGLSPRRMFQWLGTDVFRERFDSSFWITHAEHRIRRIIKSHDVIIIPDIRFVNEAEMIMSFKNHMLIRVVRPDRKDDPHKSETDMDRIPASWIDHVITNDGSLDEFYSKISDIKI